MSLSHKVLPDRLISFDSYAYVYSTLISIDFHKQIISPQLVPSVICV